MTRFKEWAKLKTKLLKFQITVSVCRLKLHELAGKDIYYLICSKIKHTTLVIKIYEKFFIKDNYYP